MLLDTVMSLEYVAVRLLIDCERLDHDDLVRSPETLFSVIPAKANPRRSLANQRRSLANQRPIETLLTSLNPSSRKSSSPSHGGIIRCQNYVKKPECPALPSGVGEISPQCKCLFTVLEGMPACNGTKGHQILTTVMFFPIVVLFPSQASALCTWIARQIDGAERGPAYEDQVTHDSRSDYNHGRGQHRGSH